MTEFITNSRKINSAFGREDCRDRQKRERRETRNKREVEEEKEEISKVTKIPLKNSSCAWYVATINRQCNRIDYRGYIGTF